MCYRAEVWTGDCRHHIPVAASSCQGMEINISMKPNSLVQTAAALELSDMDLPRYA